MEKDDNLFWGEGEGEVDKIRFGPGKENDRVGIGGVGGGGAGGGRGVHRKYSVSRK